MPTTYNKVVAGNQTLIDLSQDTVTDASHIVAGHTGHLADGTQVAGTGGGGGGTYQAKTNINPTTSSQTITPDTGYDALSSVQINAMPSGTAGTPTATKGAVSNHSVSVTPSVTNTTGYITGSTKTGTAVTVSASELVSGSETKTANGTYDVTNLAQLIVNVSGGGGGLEYETGTYTPASNTANATISFSNTHTLPPAVVVTVVPGIGAISKSTQTMLVQIFYDVYRLTGLLAPRTTSTADVASEIFYLYRANGTGVTTGNSFATTNSDNTGNSNSNYSRYWADKDKFRLYNNSSRYWRSGYDVKWFAIWAPTT